MRNYRQGDLILKGIEASPYISNSLAQSQVLERIVFRPRTHAHVLDGRVRMGQFTSRTVVFLEEAVRLEHPEHRHLLIEKGYYEVLYQRSFDNREGD